MVRNGTAEGVRALGRGFPALRRRMRLAGMLLGLLLVVGGIFGGGLVLAVAQSVGFFSALGENTFTLAHFRGLLTDDEFRASFWLTLALATAATGISTVLGLTVALAVREISRRSAALKLLLQVPIAVPHIVIAVVVINLIAPSGLIARMAFAAGLISGSADFPALVSDRYGIGIILAYVAKETPFIALMTLAVLVRLGDTHETVARTLGATWWQRLRYVTLPLVAPAAVTSSLVVFAFIFGAFEVPFLLGRPYPEMLPVLAQRHFLGEDLADRPRAIAIAVLISLIAAILVWLYMRLARALAGMERPTIL